MQCSFFLSFCDFYLTCIFYQSLSLPLVLYIVKIAPGFIVKSMTAAGSVRMTRAR